jgi:hypothetical protein
VFAASTHSKFYHFVEVNTRTAKTICGLRVAMILETEPSSAALHLVSVEPPDHVPCNHCLRLTGAETSPKAKAAAAGDQSCMGLISTPLPEMA